MSSIMYRQNKIADDDLPICIASIVNTVQTSGSLIIADSKSVSHDQASPWHLFREAYYLFIVAAALELPDAIFLVGLASTTIIGGNFFLARRYRVYIPPHSPHPPLLPPPIPPPPLRRRPPPSPSPPFSLRFQPMVPRRRMAKRIFLRGGTRRRKTNARGDVRFPKGETTPGEKRNYFLEQRR